MEQVDCSSGGGVEGLASCLLSRACCLLLAAAWVRVLGCECSGERVHQAQASGAVLSSDLLRLKYRRRLPKHLHLRSVGTVRWSSSKVRGSNHHRRLGRADTPCKPAESS